ncbi:hypothetical protein [Pseudorhodoplanes sp.]|uniref:hypothetical protein n=1 Tax=Pseudorhodoplanes sp. TaxID=1934341 RepID=UPI002B735548|nr:hypothetical protein [Pseudorhodoplanes sp.]HWV44161.1 hypothetical protein [Pseudorhodoplanes sp.]
MTAVNPPNALFKQLNTPTVERDPDYDFAPPITPPTRKKGIQCGQCGMKFDYGQAYGYCCMNNNCPTRYGR